MTPEDRITTVAAMSQMRCLTNADGSLTFAGNTAAVIAELLLQDARREAVTAERQRILDAIANCGPLGSWTDETRIRAMLRRIVLDEVTP